MELRPPNPILPARFPLAGLRLATVALLGAAALSLAPAPLRARSRGKRASAEEARERERKLEAALRQATLKVHAAYAKELARVSLWAAKGGLGKEAKEIVAKIGRVWPEYPLLAKVARAVEKARPRPDEEKAASLGKTLTSRIERADEAQAKRLYNLAAGCFKYGLFTHAWELLSDVLVLAPDPGNRYQKKARAVLGYTWDREENRWIRTWEAKMRKTRYLTEEGWVSKKDRKRWEQGLRPYLGKWISREREKEIRGRSEYNPYSVESEHFHVSTNLGRDVAWKYARLLEDFQSAFYEVFIGYYDQKAGAKLFFRHGKEGLHHRVYVFPSRVAYLTHVKGEQGNSKLLRESAGFYKPSERISRFFWTTDLQSTLPTFYHEVAHQLFEETKDATRGGSEGNNWVVEGLATYVETWVKKDGRWYPGRNTATNELRRARQLLAEGSPFSLIDFVTVDNKLFHETNRGDNYCLSGALTHFLMHGADEAYREDFVRFVSAFYAGKVKNYSLVEYLDIPEAKSVEEKFARLEKQLREHVAKLDG